MGYSLEYIKKKGKTMVKKVLFLTSLTFLSLSINPDKVSSKEQTKTDINYLESKVLYSKKYTPQIQWYDYKRALFLASHENKPILISFCRDDNKFCNKMSETTYKDNLIKDYMKAHFINIKIDPLSEDRIEANKSLMEKDLIKQYEVEGYPTVAFLDSKGKVIGGSIKGYVESGKFINILKYIATESYKKTNFQNFEKSEKAKKAGK